MTPEPVVTHLAVDFGDTEFRVQEYADGFFLIDVDDTRLIVSAEEMERIATAFVALGREKGWT